MRKLTGADIQALLRLMGDTDPRTSTMARERLLQEQVEELLPHIARAVRDPDPLIRGRSRLFLEYLRLHDLATEWRAVAGAPDDTFDLEKATFLIAKYRYPETDMAPYVAWLNQKAAAVAKDLPSGEDMYRNIGVLNRHLFVRGGLRGDAVRYYDPDNSCINRVIDRRRGIPITLSVIYLLVARRVGLPIRGVGMPGHFVVKYEGGEEETWIDPYHQGRLLSRTDCARHIRRSGYPYRKQLLQPVKDRTIVQRMLGNLHRIYVETEQAAQAEQIRVFQEILARRS